ncbi:MAG: hypothetical protein ACI8WB_003632 [Phenylobacterium sp.]|jgi:hypothetical protein
MLADYYNRHQSQPNTEKVLFRAGKGLQSAELNEIQSQAYDQTQGVADALFKEGHLIADGQVVFQSEQAPDAVLIEAGKVYLRGMVRDVAQAQLSVPMDQLVDVGVWLTTSTVTEVQDGSLRDPANGTRNYGEPGAARQLYSCLWGLPDHNPNPEADDDNPGDFFPVHKIDNGVLRVKQPPPQLDGITVALARYDKESNGSYVVNGLRALFLTQDINDQHFTLSEGKAHVDGFEISLKSAVRKSFVGDPDLQSVDSESHQFRGDGDGKMRVILSHTPLAAVTKVNGAIEKTVNLQRGLSSADPLPDISVYAIETIKQGATTYVAGTDFDLANDTVNWSRPGAEPVSGSSYQVKYRYRADIVIEDQGEDGFTVAGLVEDEVLFVDYDFKLPRIDLLTLDPEGVVRRISGISHQWQPSAPALPQGQLALASIEQHWSQNTKPAVVNQATRVVAMAEIESMQQQISDLFDLVAMERLRNDANLDAPVAKKGVFVDPFLDDDLRDKGAVQTAAIIAGELMLPIQGTVEQIGLTVHTAQTLPYTLEPVLVQAMKTASMKVNPYHAFEPLPALVTLGPAHDRWTQSEGDWSGVITARFMLQGSGNPTSFGEVLAQRSVGFSLSDFKPNEALVSVIFDGITVTAV